MTTVSKAPPAKTPQVKPVTDPQQLLPIARDMITRPPANMFEGTPVRTGQKVLIVNDTTADQLVVEALAAAILERGAHLNVVTLEGFRGLTDSIDLLDSTFSNNWYPEWVWKAAGESDIVVLAAFIKEAHTPKPALPDNLIIDNLEMNSDHMASEYESYPVELRDTIDRTTWERIVDSSRVRWTDLEGTDITIDLTPDDWREFIEPRIRRRGGPYMGGHLNFPAPSLKMNGVIVATSLTFGGPVPRTVLTVEKGKVTRVQGEGKFADRLRDNFERYARLTCTQFEKLGPGVNWVTSIGLGTHPGAFRSPYFDRLAGSARVYAWSFGHRRSGVIHTSMGEGLVSPTYRVIRHVDTYFNTIVADKGAVVENGHLTALEDPRVRQVAARYGDPDKLLEEVWIPSVPGVNA